MTTKPTLTLCFIVCFFLLFAEEVSFAAQKDASELAKLCQKSWDELACKDIHYSEHCIMTTVNRVSNKPEQIDRTSHFHWICSGQNHILHYLQTDKNAAYQCIRYDGQVLSEEDGFAGSADVIPKSLEESIKSKGRCRAGVARSTPVTAMILFPEHTLFNMTFAPRQGSDAVPVNFYQYIAEHQSDVPKQSRNASGDVLWTFRLEFSAVPDEEKCYCMITLNESKSYFLHEIVSVVPAKLSHAMDKKTGEKLAIYSQSLVTEYMELPNGKFFPKTIITGFGPLEAWNERKGFPDDFYANQYTITDIKIDGAKNNYRFNIPEFYLVLRNDLFDFDKMKEGDVIPISVWGGNNEPLVTFYTNAEYDEYIKNALVEPLMKKPFSMSRILLMGIGLLLIISPLLMKLYSKKNT